MGTRWNPRTARLRLEREADTQIEVEIPARPPQPPPREREVSYGVLRTTRSGSEALGICAAVILVAA